MRSGLSGLFLILLVTLGSALASSQSSGLRLVHASTLPQVADGQFGGGSIRTTFFLFNNGDRSTDVTLEVRDDNGDPFPVTIPELGASDTFEFTLAEGETRVLETDASGPVRAGSARVTSGIRIGVSAVLTLLDPQGVAVSETGVGSVAPLASMELPVDVDNGLNTGIALRNNSYEEPVTAVLTLRDSNGLQRGVPVMVTIPGEGHLAQFVSGDLFGDLGAFSGKLEITTSGRVSALALRQHSSPLSFTTLPVVDSQATETDFSLPQVTNHPLVRTSFVLLNPSTTSPANVMIQLTGNDGGPLPVQLSDGRQGSEFLIQVPPRGTRSLTTTGEGEPAAGAARLSSDVPLGVAGILTLVNESGDLVGETGIGASPTFTEATIPIDNRTARTGLALLNNSPRPATVSVRFTRAAGVNQPGANLNFESPGPVEVPPFGHFAVFASQFGLTVLGRTGTLAISSTEPVSALTLRQRDDPLSLTTLPVAAGIAASAPPTVRVLTRSVGQIDLTTDSMLDEELADGFELCGGVDLPGPFDRILGVYAFALEGGSQIYSGSVAESPNRYRIILPPGVYAVRVAYQVGQQTLFPEQRERLALLRRALGSARSAKSAAPFPVSFVSDSFEVPGVVVEGNTLRSLRRSQGTGRFYVTGHLTGLQTLPQELTRLPLTLDFLPIDSTTGGTSVTGLDGAFETRLANGRYLVSLLLAEFETNSQTSLVPRLVQVVSAVLGEFTVNGASLNLDFQVPDLVRLSGTVSLPFSAGIPEGTAIYAAQAESNLFTFGTGLAFPNPGGAYHLDVLRNVPYVFQLQTSLESPPGRASAPGVGSTPQESFSQDSTRNFSSFPSLPPTVTLTGQVTGPSGPLAGVSVSALAIRLSEAPEVTFSTSTTTDSEGNYSLPVLRGPEYSLRFEPALSFAGIRPEVPR